MNQTVYSSDLIISWVKAPALYVTMSQAEVVEEVMDCGGSFLDLAVRV